jgi:hypothetical protein
VALHEAMRGDEPAQQVTSPPRARVSDGVGGFAWLTAWAGASVFAAGAIILVAPIVTRIPDPYAGAAVLAVAICVLGVAIFAVAGAAWLVRLLLDRSFGRRRLAAIVALAGAAASLTALVADQVGALGLPDETWPFVLVGVSLLALGAILAARASERRPALAFGVVWVLLVGVLAYGTWTG